MNSMEVTVWYEGSCSTFGAPEMSLMDGFVHDDNYVDYSNPDDGIFWERSCVYREPNEDGTVERHAPIVVDDETGEVVATLSSLEDAERVCGLLETGDRPLRVLDGDWHESGSDLRVFSHRVRLVDGEELKLALKVQVRGVTVLVRDECATTRCGLCDVTRRSLGFSDPGPDGEEDADAGVR